MEMSPDSNEFIQEAISCLERVRDYIKNSSRKATLFVCLLIDTDEAAPEEVKDNLREWIRIQLQDNGTLASWLIKNHPEFGNRYCQAGAEFEYRIAWCNHMISELRKELYLNESKGA